MLTQIQGLHHITSLASSASGNNRFFTQVLGLRRVKTTVNFDNPEVYHLYYGDEAGSPGSVMTYFPFPNAKRGQRGTGEVSTTAFAVPFGASAFWADRLTAHGVLNVQSEVTFGQNRLTFDGPDGDHFALIEVEDARVPWTGPGIPHDVAIRGFHSAAMRLADAGATAELLGFMGYEVEERQGKTTRLIRPGGNAANRIEIEALPNTKEARSGAGSVHHIAFAVENRARQLEVREALRDTGWAVTPVIDRDYFHAIYFRTPGGVLFEVATNEPGFDRDEDSAHLGEALKLPSQHEHLRNRLKQTLEPLED